MRRYCWMVGAAYDIPDDGKCPECCQPAEKHRPVSDPAICGSFVSVSDTKGTECRLPPDHPGGCKAQIDRPVLEKESHKRVDDAMRSLDHFAREAASWARRLEEAREKHAKVVADERAWVERVALLTAEVRS